MRNTGKSSGDVVWINAARERGRADWERLSTDEAWAIPVEGGALVEGDAKKDDEREVAMSLTTRVVFRSCRQRHRQWLWRLRVFSRAGCGNPHVGSMSGVWKRSMVGLVRHRQTGSRQPMVPPKPPRHTSTHIRPAPKCEAKKTKISPAVHFKSLAPIVDRRAIVFQGRSRESTRRIYDDYPDWLAR